MRLLSKPEVQQQLTTERKLAIDEGIGLARKVDGLRQTASKEQANLTTFRTATVHEALDEIAALLNERDQIKKEIASLNGIRDAALEPLYAKEAEVDQKLQKQAEQARILDDRVFALDAWEVDYGKRQRELLVDEGRVADDKQRTLAALAEAEGSSANARALEKQINLKATRQTARHAKKDKELAAREGELEARELDVENRRKNLDKRESELNAQETRVKDLYQTYMRHHG